VARETEFQSEMQKIGTLVRELETIADPASQSAAKELVRLLMNMHEAGLQRILETLARSGELGSGMIQELSKDPIVSGLLVLYDLHPEDLQARVEQKLRTISSALFRMGAEACLVSISDGHVRIRVETNGKTCGSTLGQLQKFVEDAIYEAAPDLSGLTLDGLEPPTASGFVGLEKLLSGATSSVT
jgi:hypothetical protein